MRIFKSQKGFAPVLTIVLVAALIVVAIFYLKSRGELHNFIPYGPQSTYNSGSGFGNQNPNYAMAGDNGSTTTASLPTCPQGNTLFDHLPTDSNLFTNITPMGNMSGEHILPDQADHLYFNMLPSQGGSSQATPVYAPGNVTIIQIEKSIGTQGANKGVTDYVIMFSPCRSVIFAYVHIKAISDKLQSAITNQNPTCQQGSVITACTYPNLSIKMQSGERIGVAGGPGTINSAFDFGGADVRIPPLQFIDTGSNAFTGLTASSYFHTICPLDYFTPSLKASLYAKLTIKNAGTNGIPECGITMQDKVGTSQGNWYHQGGTSQYQGLDLQGLLGIVHSNLDPSMGEISVGTDLIPSKDFGAQMIFQPQSSGYINREPSQITPDGHVYCFDGQIGIGGSGSEGHVDIELTSPTILRVDYGNGACSTNPILNNPLTYIR